MKRGDRVHWAPMSQDGIVIRVLPLTRTAVVSLDRDPMALVFLDQSVLEVVPR